MNLKEKIAKTGNALRQVSLLFLVKDDMVLLAMKKRGFGKGRWNGYGGKANPGEQIEQTAIRETQEEIGVTPKSIKRHAVLDFYFTHRDDWDQRVYVYLCDEWDGEPTESEEMAPKWFNKNELPFDSMWDEDPYWLEKVLGGKTMEGSFLFNENDKLVEREVREL